MKQEGNVTVDHVIKDHMTVAEFTSKEWNNKGGFSMSAFLGSSIAFGVIGLVVALILMIFLPDMRNFSAVALFSAAFGVLFGSMAQKAEQSRGKTFLFDLSTKINIILTELGGHELQNITPSQLKKLIKSGEDHPLTVDGVAGLHLMIREDQIVRTSPPPARVAPAAAGPQKVEKSGPSSKCWRVVVGTEAPQYGIESFDRLLDSATSTASTEQ